MSLLEKKCVPCEGGVPPLSAEQARAFLGQVPGWELDEDSMKLWRTWKLADFREAMVFVNAVAEIANAEDHHPNIAIAYSRVTLELWTHAIDGLSENDFIVAAKVNTLGYGTVP